MTPDESRELKHRVRDRYEDAQTHFKEELARLDELGRALQKLAQKLANPNDLLASDVTLLPTREALAKAIEEFHAASSEYGQARKAAAELGLKVD